MRRQLISYYERVLGKTNKLTFTARDTRRIRRHIQELAELEELLAGYRVILETRLETTARVDESLYTIATKNGI